MSKPTILITGCSSGIGFDAARTLRERGWRVFASCRQQKDCDRLRAAGFESPLIDHADPASIEAGLNDVLAATDNRLDALFNNGAWGLPALIEDTPREAMEAIFAANFFGVHDLTRRVVRVMRAQGHGRIIMCSSVLGLVAIPWRGPYAASKFAMEALSDTLRVETRDGGIHVSIIEPGPITTAFRKNTIAPYERWIDANASAKAEVYKTRIEPRMYSKDDPDRFELPAEAVTKKLIHALDSPRPWARYYVTFPTYLMAVLNWLLPRYVKDRILHRI